MFKAAKQNRIFQDVVDQIEEAILKGELRPGDTLPPERYLKEIFQTSRGTLREALRVLEHKGLIEIRLGGSGGAFVKNASIEQFSESLGLLIKFQKISLEHLAEFREGVEGAVADIAARRADREDIRTLELLIGEAREHVEKGVAHWEDFLEVDKKFHTTLARITGNPIYNFVHRMIHDNIQQYYDKFLPASEEVLNENFQDLCQIVELVKKGETGNARLTAQRHVRRFNEYMTIRSEGGLALESA